MMIVRDIVELIERHAPRSWQQSWDNSGLQVGLLDTTLRGVVVTVDVTDSCLDYALECGANLIVSHHPLIFTPLRGVGDSNITDDSVDHTARLVYRAAAAGVAVYSAHTNLDSAIGGINDRLAAILGLLDVVPLEPDRTAGVPVGVGMGAVGVLGARCTAAAFMEILRLKLGVPVVRHNFHASSVSEVGELWLEAGTRIALCGGSGGSMVQQAMEAKAQIFITGDLKYGDFQRTAGRLTLLDVGHWETEAHASEIFYEIITEKIHTFARGDRHADTPKIYRFNSNQVKYYL